MIRYIDTGKQTGKGEYILWQVETKDFTKSVLLTDFSTKLWIISKQSMPTNGELTN
jgi:hypothetical protein